MSFFICTTLTTKYFFKLIVSKSFFHDIQIIGDSISDSNTSKVVEPKRKTSRAEIKLAKPE